MLSGGLSLALDSSDYAHISYFSGYPNDDLKYAHWNGSAWEIELVDSEGDVGMWSSLALDDSGRPHISYFDDSNETIKYASWNGSTWHIETVDSVGSANTTLALDDSDFPCIAYNSHTPLVLRYAHWDGGAWQIENVEIGCSARGVSLALDSSGYPHISYSRETNPDLTYASWDGDEWTREIVDSEGSCYHSSLAIDETDRPQIAYHTSYGYYLRYARWNGGSWQLFIIDPERNVGKYTSLALDSSGNPHISYYDENDTSLKYAHWEGGVGVEGAEVFAKVGGDGVLVGWEIVGDAPAGVRVLRSAGESEPVAIHDNPLPGTATHYLDRVDKGLQPLAGVEYRYWLDVVDEDGTVSRFGPSEAVEFPGAARELSLSVYPSPASSSFTVEYTLPEDDRISISLYDLSGRRVATVYDGETAAGRHAFSCDAAALTPGVYLVHLATEAGSLTRRVVVAR